MRCEDGGEIQPGFVYTPRQKSVATPLPSTVSPLTTAELLLLVVLLLLQQ